jgi:hypothetical protein
MNSTGSLAILLQYATLYITGSESLTLIVLLLLSILLGLAFRLPIEVILLLEVPIILVLMAFYSEFLAIGGLILIGLAIVFALNYFIRK